MGVSFIAKESLGREGGPDKHSDNGVDDISVSSSGVISRAPRFASLMVATISLLMLTALGVGVSATWRAIDQERQVAEESLRNTAQALEVAVNLEIARRLSAVETLAAASSNVPMYIAALEPRVRMVALDLGVAAIVVDRDETRLVSTRVAPDAPLPEVPINGRPVVE